MRALSARLLLSGFWDGYSCYLSERVLPGTDGLLPNLCFHFVYSLRGRHLELVEGNAGHHKLRPLSVRACVSGGNREYLGNHSVSGGADLRGCHDPVALHVVKQRVF